MLEAEITAAGDVFVEGQHVGSLQGFRFTADPGAAGEAAKALNAAAQKALASEFDARATRIFDAVDDAFVLGNDGTIRWLGEPVGKIAQGSGVLKPTAHVLADEQLNGAVLDKVKQRLELWLSQRVKKLLGALEPLESGDGLSGAVRGVAFQIAEELGVLERGRVAKEIKGFSQEDRAALRKLGVRFGAYHLYLPLLLKPAPRALAALLWALRHGGLDSVKGLEEAPHLAASGRTSFAADPSIAKGFYRAAGYRLCGERVVRVDILERLADLIRPAIAYRPGVSVGEPPAGAADADGFVVTVAMTSLTGCAGDAFSSILRSLGYANAKRPGPAITVPLISAAPTQPLTPVVAENGSDSPVEQTEPGEKAEGAAAELTMPTPAAEGQETALHAAESEAAESRPVESQAADNQVVESEPAKAAPAEETPPAAAEPVAETSAEEPAAETAAATEAVSEEAATTEAAETVVLIEIWSPQRHAPQQRRHEGERRPPRRAEAGGEASLAPREEPPRDGEAQEARPQAERPRHQRPHVERPDGQRPARNQPRGDAPKGGFRSGGKPGQGPRPDQRDNRAPRDEGRARPTSPSPPPQRRERLPDPDSPFAKLLALKAELEKKGKS
jgi:ATP-dependent RNA helicase SUPV3L1/SUV3